MERNIDRKDRQKGRKKYRQNLDKKMVRKIDRKKHRKKDRYKNRKRDIKKYKYTLRIYLKTKLYEIKNHAITTILKMFII